jgi:drug/metabolite transporter (DMT)-like permease
MAALKGKVLVAYLLVCVVWGSTYLAIRVGVQELPPFLFAGVRFVVAGAVLLALARALRYALPATASEWRTHAVVGVLLLAGGNAFVVWAEQYVTSGAASVFVVTVALWMAFFDAILPGGKARLEWRVMVGLLLGFLGTTLLVGASPAEILAADLRGPLALTGASASWALGSVYSKRHQTDTSPYVASSLQMLIGGSLVTLVGLALGEAGRWYLSPTGLGALAYLAVFGSIVGYSAYAYALRHASATIVGTYAYVNPVVAVLLGWAILDEPVGVRTFAAMGLILGAVVWIQMAHGLPRRDGMTERRKTELRRKDGMTERRKEGATETQSEEAAEERSDIPSFRPSVRPSVDAP